MQSQAQNIIFGVDIVKGSSRSREAPRYALVILNGEVERYPTYWRWTASRSLPLTAKS
jgi:predicted RNase H-like nuclease (RuvC/YqgF family)